MSREVQHEILPEGESTARWAILTEPGFRGSIKQLVCCARCGDIIRSRPDEPGRFRDIGKPTLHRLCEDCHDTLPE